MVKLPGDASSRGWSEGTTVAVEQTAPVIQRPEPIEVAPAVLQPAKPAGPDPFEELKSLGDAQAAAVDPPKLFEEPSALADELTRDGTLGRLADEHAIGKETDLVLERAKSGGKSLGILGDIGLLDEKGRASWLTDEIEDAKSSLEIRAEQKKRSDEAVDIFRKGAPKAKLHPWLAEQQAFRDKSLEEAEKRVHDADEMAAGTRLPAIKGLGRASTEQFVQGTSSIVSGIVKSAGIAAGYAGKAAGADIGPDDNMTYRLGQWIEAKTKELFPGDAARQAEFSQKLAQGAGSMVGFYGPAIVGKLLKASDRKLLALAGTTGALAEGASTFDEATQSMQEGRDVPEMARFMAFGGGLLLGATEALPISKMLKGGGGSMVARTFDQMLEEGGQEGFQTFGENFLAKYFHDPNRDLGQGVLENMAIGGILGGVMQGAQFAVDKNARAAVSAERDTPNSNPPSAPQASPPAAVLPDAAPIPQPTQKPARSSAEIGTAEPIQVRPVQSLAETENEVVTPDGSMALPVETVLVELDDLVYATGDLQPRDRSRKESAEGVRYRAANLDPSRLLPQRVSDVGAPIVATDGTIVSGNGRVLSIAEVYRDPVLAARAEAYRQALGPEAEGMRQPVLIRRLAKDAAADDLVKFADLSNRPAIAQMSATERAGRDSRAAGADVMRLYTGGDFARPENRDFLRAFVNAAVSPTERGAMARDGMLTKEGQDRLTSAVLAAAYGNQDVLSRMLESTDDNIRSISGAMRDAAGAMLQLKQSIANGETDPKFDITPMVAEAALRIADMRAKGVKPANMLAQQDAFSQIDPLVEGLIRAFYTEDMTRPVSRKAMTDVLTFYAREAALHSGQEGLIPDETTPQDVLALARTRSSTGDFGADDLFSDGESLIGRGNAESGGGNEQSASGGRGSVDGDFSDVNTEEFSASVSGKGRGPSTTQGQVDFINEIFSSPEQTKRAAFDAVLSGTAPRKDWQRLTQTTPSEIESLELEAIADGRLRLAKDGKLRRTGKAKIAQPMAQPERGSPSDLARRGEAAREAMLSPEYQAATATDPANDTSLVDGYMSPAWKKARVYKTPSGDVTGFDAAVAYLVDQASGQVPGGIKSERKVFIMLGMMGAGKSTIANGIRTAQGAAHVVADDAKIIIPEYAGGANSTGVHKESADLAQYAMSSLSETGSNIIVEKIGGSPSSIGRLISDFKGRGYETTLVHVDVPVEIAMERAVSRWRDTGRAVPLSAYEGLDIGATFDKLRTGDEINEAARIAWSEKDREWVNEGDGENLGQLRFGAGTGAVQPGLDGLDRGQGLYRGRQASSRSDAGRVNPALSIDPASRIERAIALRETASGLSVNVIVSDYALKAETVRGDLAATRALVAEISADKVIRKADALELAHLVGYPPSKSTTKKAALESIIARAVAFNEANQFDMLMPVEQPSSGADTASQDDSLAALKSAAPGSFTDEFADALPEWVAQVAAEARRILPADVAVRFEDRIFHSGMELDAAYSPSAKLLEIGLSHGLMRALELARHEAVHVARMGNLFDAAEWTLLLERAAKVGIDAQVTAVGADGRLVPALPIYAEMYGKQANKLGLTGAERGSYVNERLNQERVAKMAEQWASGKADYGSRINALLDRLRGLIEALLNAALGLGFQTAEDVFQKFMSGDVAARSEAGRHQPRFASERRGTDRGYMGSPEREAVLEGFGLASMPMDRPDVDSLGYFSGALEAAKRLRQERGTPEQMLAMLKKEGAKEAELESVNLSQLLDGKTTITKSEIISYLEANRVDVREANYGETPEVRVHASKLDALREQMATIQKETAARVGHHGGPELDNDPRYMALVEEFDRLRDQRPSYQNTKWSSYSLDPGNPTYRETVLHLPANKPDFAKFKAESISNGVPDAEIERNYQRLLSDAGRMAREDATNFQSGHFSEPNIIGHMMTSMVKHEGKATYLVDQIQSDWGQKLRDGGVRDEAKIAEWEKRLEGRQKLFNRYVDEKATPFLTANGLPAPRFSTQAIADLRSFARDATPELADQAREIERLLMSAHQPIDMINAELATLKASTPGHPLVNTTDQWVNTTLRRAIRQAAEADAEYIAIPSGKTVLSYNPGDEHGMEGFYSGIVPKNLKNLLKKMDRETPDPVSIDKLETPSRGMAGKGFTIFKLTDKVKDAVLNGGQPLFALSTVKRNFVGTDGGSITSRAKPDGNRVRTYKVDGTGFVSISEQPDGTWAIQMLDARKPQALYNLIEAVQVDLGQRLSPKGWLTPDAYSYWMETDASKVKGHVNAGPLFNGLYVPVEQIDFAVEILGEVAVQSPDADVTRRAALQIQQLKALKSQVAPASDDLLAAFRQLPTPIEIGSQPTNALNNMDPLEQSLTDLVKRVTDAMGLTVRRGRLNPGLKAAAGRRGGWIAGQHSNKTGVTRLAIPNDLVTLAHEGGHHLESDAKFKAAIDALKRKHAEDLVLPPMPDVPPSKFPASGFTGIEIDAETQQVLVGAVKKDAELRQMATYVGNAKSSRSTLGAARPLYDIRAYQQTQQDAGALRELLGRRLGQRVADAAIDDMKASGAQNLAAYAALRFSAAGQPSPRQKIKWTAKQLSEGFADWFSQYVISRDAAKAIAPGMTNEFEDVIEGLDPDMLEALEGVQDGYQKLLQASPVQAVASRVQSTIREGKLAELRKTVNEKGWRDTLNDWVYAFYTAAIDGKHPMKVAVKYLIKTAAENLGVKLSDKERIVLKAIDDPYKRWRLAEHSKVHATNVIQSGVRFSGDDLPTGPSYHDALSIAFGGTHSSQWNEQKANLFGSYLIARRMLAEFGRFDRGELENQPDLLIKRDTWQLARDQLEQKYPDFAQAADAMYEFSKNVLKWKMQEGFISHDTYVELIQRVDYTPLNRIMDDKSPSSLTSAKGPNKAKMIRRFMGSTRDFINPLESIVQDVYATQARVALNGVIRSMDKLARAAGPGGGLIAERIPAKDMVGTKVDLRQAMRSAAKSQGLSQSDYDGIMEIIDDLFDQNAAANIFRATDTNEKGEPILYLWENGTRVPIRIGDDRIGKDIFEQMVAFGQDNSDLLIDTGTLFTQALRAGVTKAPAYVAVNFLRDQLATWILSDVFTPFVTGAKGLKSTVMNGTDAIRFQAFGGQMGGVDARLMDSAGGDRDILSLRKKGFWSTPGGSVAGRTWNGFLRTMEVTEAATRVGHFEAARQRALADGMTKEEAAFEAAYAAHDVMDFSRRGARMATVSRLVAFLNANLQALDAGRRTVVGERDSATAYRKLATPYIKAVSGSPLSMAERQELPNSTRAVLKMLAIGMIGVALSALYSDDDEAEEINDYMRATHWFFKLGGTWYRYPKPFELAVFSNAMESGFDWLWKSDPRAGAKFLHSLHHSFVPPHELQAMKFFYEMKTGKDTFRDRDIVGMDIAGLPPELQYNAYTSEFGKMVGSVAGLSPTMVDHFMQSAFATVGRDVLTVSDYVLPRVNRATGGALPGVSVTPRAEKSVEDYWFVSRFTRRAARGSLSSEYFWKQISPSGGEYAAFAQGYKKLYEAGRVDPRTSVEAKAMLDRMTDDQKAFAYLETHFTEKEQDVHPLNRAKQVMNIASGIRKEMILGGLIKQGSKKKNLEPELVDLPYSAQKKVNEILEDVSMREARNALIVTGVDGWAQKDILPIDGLIGELRSVAPDVADEFEARQTKGRNKVYSFEAVKSLWPELRKRLLDEGPDAIVSDIAAEAGGY